MMKKYKESHPSFSTILASEMGKWQAHLPGHVYENYLVIIQRQLSLQIS